MKNLRYRAIVLLFIIISLCNARMFDPGVARAIVIRGLNEFKKTKNIKKLQDFKQAYQDMAARVKDNYADDYQEVITAIAKKSAPKSLTMAKKEEAKSNPLIKITEELEKEKDKKNDKIKEIFEKEPNILVNIEEEKDIKLEKEKLEKEKLEKEKLEKEKLEKEKLEKEKLEKEKLEKEKLEKEKEKQRSITVHNKTSKSITCRLYSCNENAKALGDEEGLQASNVICTRLREKEITIGAGKEMRLDYEKLEDNIPYLIFKDSSNKDAKLGDTLTYKYFDQEFGNGAHAIDIKDLTKYTIKEEITQITIINNRANNKLNGFTAYKYSNVQTFNNPSSFVIDLSGQNSIDIPKPKGNQVRYLVLNSNAPKKTVDMYPLKLNIETLKDKAPNNSISIKINSLNVKNTDIQISFDQGKTFESINKWLER